MKAEAVLFDLDGTLADTALDMVVALNKLLNEEGKQPVTYEQFCPQLSQGGSNILQFFFDNQLDKSKEQRLHKRFLELYAEILYVDTCLFPEVETTLQKLTQAGIVWGIVTNKNQILAEPLIDQLRISYAACQVYGDTTASKKPSPEPLIYAANQIRCTPKECFYVGDSMNDMRAAKAAGMHPIFATYGYGSQSSLDNNLYTDKLLHRFSELPSLLKN